MLNKVEVGVHFFQVYALMIVLTVNIPWPNLWNKIKSVFDWPGKLFNIDLVGAFAMIDVKLRPEIQSYVRFGVIMALPLLFFAIYAKARTMDSRVWYGLLLFPPLLLFARESYGWFIVGFETMSTNGSEQRRLRGLCLRSRWWRRSYWGCSTIIRSMWA
jgi:hypothetical protein